MLKFDKIFCKRTPPFSINLHKLKPFYFSDSMSKSLKQSALSSTSNIPANFNDCRKSNVFVLYFSANYCKDMNLYRNTLKIIDRIP